MNGSSIIKPAPEPPTNGAATKQTTRPRFFSKDRTGNMMYGDIVIGLWWCIVVPIHGRDLWMLDRDDPNLPGARIVYAALVVACGLCVASIATGKMLYSRMAFLANIYAMSVTNLYEFPFPGECAITPMMVGGTVLGVLSNFSLEFTEKMLRLPVYFGAGSYVCIHSPYCTYEDDTRPILGGTILLEMTILVVHHYGGIRKILKHLNCVELNLAHVARIVLACLFLHHLASTLNQLGGSLDHREDFDPNHTLAERFFIMVQAGVVACVGVAATGAFQEEISLKEKAERKAKEESMMAKAMADSMMVLTHELRTPLQGIMGATSMLLQDKEAAVAAAAAAGVVGDSKKETDDETESESLKLIMASSGLLLNLINNMLDVKRVAEGMMEEFPLTLFPAVEPIRDAIGFCLPLASISNVSVQVDYGADTKMEHALVRSNALRLQQVFINLISNAIKYTNNDGESTSVIKVSLRSTTVEDVNWRMMRSLASSYTVTSGTTTKGQSNQQQQPTNDPWSLKDSTEKVILFGVSDCGPGIDQAQANRLFRRFGRLDDKPKRTLGASKVGQPSGTGLGLHLCQLFVQRMEGQIWATNNPDGQGATFFFCLPLGLENHKAAQRKSIKAVAPSRLPKRPSVKAPTKRNWGIRFDRRRGHFEEKDNHHNPRDDTGGKLGYPDDDARTQSTIPSLIDCDNSTQISILSDQKQAPIPVYQRSILVVDDTMINRKILHRMLKQIGCTKVCLVGSGEAALQELKRNRFDLVITDLQMPGMDGNELSEKISAINDGFFITPVVIGLTADSSQQTTDRCKASGMSDVIHKPITCDELRHFFDQKVSVLIEQNRSAYLEP